jgi:hypothetical protein
MRLCNTGKYHMLSPIKTYVERNLVGLVVGWSRKSIFFIFAKYKISAKVNLISRNFAKFRENFVTKISRNFVYFLSRNFVHFLSQNFVTKILRHFCEISSKFRSFIFVKYRKNFVTKILRNFAKSCRNFVHSIS